MAGTIILARVYPSSGRLGFSKLLLLSLHGSPYPIGLLDRQKTVDKVQTGPALVVLREGRFEEAYLVQIKVC